MHQRCDVTIKERAWNNLNNYGAGFLLLMKLSQEVHSCSTQRLRLFSQKQKDQPECSSYFMHTPKGQSEQLRITLSSCNSTLILRIIVRNAVISPHRVIISHRIIRYIN